MIVEFIKKFFSNIIGYVSIIASIVTIILIKGNLVIEKRWMFLVLIVFLAIIMTLCSILVEKNNEIKRIGNTPEDFFKSNVLAYENDNGNDLFYINYNPYIPVDTLVSIYYHKVGNKLICSGRIIDVNPNEYITVQVLSNSTVKGRENLLKEIRTSETNILGNVYIRLLVKAESISLINPSMKQ